jgi:integrase
VKKCPLNRGNSKALNDAKVDRYIPYNPLSDVKPPKVNRERRQPITLASVQAKLHALSDHRLYAMFHLGFLGGMRRAELCALQWESVDLEQGMIQVTKSMSRLSNNEIYVGAPKTNSGVRSLPIDRDTSTVLRQHRKEQAIERLKAGDLYQDNGLVFCNADGSYLVPSYVGQSYTYHIKKYLGIHETLHGMRHAHGSILHEAGEELKAIQDRLGHASVATTQRYIHASAEQQRGAVDAIAKKLRPRTRTKAQ